MDNDAELKAEAEKLGPRGRERIIAVQDYIAAQIGHDRAGDMAANLTTAAQIEGWEKIMANARSERRTAEIAATASASAAAPSPQRTEQSQEPIRVDEATFQKMSAAEKFDYARQFPQGR